jgi:hypothetical protein
MTLTPSIQGTDAPRPGSEHGLLADVYEPTMLDGSR